MKLPSRDSHFLLAIDKSFFSFLIAVLQISQSHLNRPVAPSEPKGSVAV